VTGSMPAAATPAPSAAARLIDDVEALRRSRPAEALEVLRRDFAAAVRLAEPAVRGELWRLRGHVLRALRRTAEAVTCYRRAERWFAHAGDGREVGRCAIGLVDSLMYLGRYDDAHRAASRGRHALERARDRGSLARLLNNEGNLFHRLDRPDRALGLYRRSRRALVAAGDARGAAIVDGNIANCLSLLGRCGEARRLYRRARDANARRGFAVDALNAEYNLAYLDFLEHRHERALHGLARVRETAGRDGPPSLAALAALDRAEIMLRLGAHYDALDEARKAVTECGALGLTYERAKAGTYAALAEFRLGRNAAAAARLERVLAVFVDEGNGVWTGETLVGLATVWSRRGSPRAAGTLLAAAAGRFAAAGDAEREGCALALLARARLEGGSLRGAASALARARRCERRRPSIRLRQLVAAAAAELARARGQPGTARRHLRRAAREAERLAARILDEHWRASFWGHWGWPHQRLAALELEGGRVASAFEELERGRGRTLLESSGRASRSLPAPVRTWAAAALARDRDRSTRAGAHLHAGTPAPAGIPAPSRRAPRSGLAAPPSIREDALRRALAPGTRLVDFAFHDGALRAFLLERRSLEVTPALVTERELDRMVHGVLFGLRSASRRGAGDGAADAALQSALAELASLVLWPVLGPDADGVVPSSLAIVPAGALARLPWAGLPLPDGAPLCSRMPVTIVPGLRLGLSRRHRPRSSSAPLVVAADVGGLENVAAETEAIRRIFPDCRVLRGADATASAFLAAAAAARWIHFAGHALYRPDAPDRSGLCFADRWVHADELQGLRLSARWVTLSACQGARALVRPGEEWFGLARTLLRSGAGTVLAVQWDVEDSAAAGLMAELYPRLAAAAPPAAALAAAQAARAAAAAHPLEWAGFVALGGPGLAAGGGLE